MLGAGFINFTNRLSKIIGDGGGGGGGHSNFTFYSVKLCVKMNFSLHHNVLCLSFVVHTFYKKLRSGPSIESFLAFGDLEYSKFLNSFSTLF